MTKRNSLLFAGTALSCALLGILPGGIAMARADQATDSQIAADVHKALDNKRYQDVSIAVHNGDVILSGKVGVYADKEEADRRVHHVHQVKGVVSNNIEVAEVGPASAASDQALRDKLAKQLSYDRVGYGTTSCSTPLPSASMMVWSRWGVPFMGQPTRTPLAEPRSQYAGRSGRR